MSSEKKQPKKRQYVRKPVIEITEENYMTFSAKDLYTEIVKLRALEEANKALVLDNKNLRTVITKVNKLTSKGAED